MTNDYEVSCWSQSTNNSLELHYFF